MRISVLLGQRSLICIWSHHLTVFGWMRVDGWTNMWAKKCLPSVTDDSFRKLGQYNCIYLCYTTVFIKVVYFNSQMVEQIKFKNIGGRVDPPKWFRIPAGHTLCSKTNHHQTRGGPPVAPITKCHPRDRQYYYHHSHHPPCWCGAKTRPTRVPSIWLESHNILIQDSRRSHK